MQADRCIPRRILAGGFVVPIRGNIATWLGSAALAGLVLAKLPARQKKVYVNAHTGKAQPNQKAKGGILVALLGLGLQLAKPFLQKYLVEQAHQLAQKHLPGEPRDRVAESKLPQRRSLVKRPGGCKKTSSLLSSRSTL